MPQNATKLLSATGIITTRKACKLVHVTIAQVGGAGSKLDLYDNNDGTGTPFYTVDGTVANNHLELWLPCSNGLYGKITTGGIYNIIFN